MIGGIVSHYGILDKGGGKLCPLNVARPDVTNGTPNSLNAWRSPLGDPAGYAGVEILASDPRPVAQ